MTKYYRDMVGNYLGGFDGAGPPDGAIEVHTPPNHGADKFIAGVWVTPPPTQAQINAQANAEIAKQLSSVQEAMLSIVNRIGTPAEKAGLAGAIAAIAAARAQIQP